MIDWKYVAVVVLVSGLLERTIFPSCIALQVLTNIHVLSTDIGTLVTEI